jgi:hypothetical protein
MCLNNKQKVTYKVFVRQIVYLSEKKRLNPKNIRKILKSSYAKRVIPSKNVIINKFTFETIKKNLPIYFSIIFYNLVYNENFVSKQK